jgi:hypothetical protein
MAIGSLESQRESGMWRKRIESGSIMSKWRSISRYRNESEMWLGGGGVMTWRRRKYRNRRHRK